MSEEVVAWSGIALLFLLAFTSVDEWTPAFLAVLGMIAFVLVVALVISAIGGRD